MDAELPFKIEPMTRPMETERTIYHVGVSGGKDSAAALIWMVRESGIAPSKIKATFCDIGNDHEWTLEHIALLSEKVHPIETIRPARSFFELALDKHRFPSAKARFCTEHLKIIPTRDHITRLVYARNKVIAVSGVRGDESVERSLLDEWDYSGTLLCPSWRPLIRWTLADVLAIHKRHSIPLNPLYSIGALRVGCWPCVMSRKSEIRNIALNFPERIDQIRAAELLFESTYGRFSSFFGPGSVPARFCSRLEWSEKKRELIPVPTIDDVVRWSMTGKNAEGSYLDEPQPEPACMSGFCE